MYIECIVNARSLAIPRSGTGPPFAAGDVDRPFGLSRFEQ